MNWRKILRIFKIVIVNIVLFCLITESSIRIILSPYFPEINIKIFAETFCNNYSYHIGKACKPINGAPFLRIRKPFVKKYDAIVVGDSFVFGGLVKPEHTIPSQMELATGKDVLNLGMPGAGPLEYNELVKIGLQYDPEIILYCVFANDFHDSIYSKDWENRQLNSGNNPGKAVDWEAYLFCGDKENALVVAVNAIKREFKTYLLLCKWSL